jgi:hypothetical protein
MKITSATIFQRVFTSNNAFILGVIETSRPCQLAEGLLYPICFDRNTIYQSHGLPIYRSPDEDPYYHTTMDFHLKMAIWPRVRGTGDWGGLFWTLVIPLPGNGCNYFVYAALEQPVFANPLESWNQLTRQSGTWATIQPLSKSIGENALTLTRKTYWPIDGGLFHIEPGPTRFLEVHGFITALYLSEYRKVGSVEHLYQMAREASIEAGLEEGLVESLLWTMHRQFSENEYIEVIEQVEQRCPLPCRRMVTKAEYLKRGLELRRQINKRVEG